MFGKTGGIQLKSVLKKEHSLICVTILSAMFGLTGCGGSDGESKFDITRPIESTLEITLDGIFTDSDEMTVEFDGDHDAWCRRCEEEGGHYHDTVN